MMKNRILSGLAAGIAAVVLVSGCSSKNQRLTPTGGAKGLLSSRDIVPPPFSKPSDLKMLPPAESKGGIAQDVEPTVVPVGPSEVPEPELQIVDARLKSVVPPAPAAKGSVPSSSKGFVPAPEASTSGEVKPIFDLGSQVQSSAEVAPKVTYTVRRGDTLTKIARLHGVTWREIATVNHLTHSSTIKVGQVLTMPAGAKLDTAALKASTPSKPVAAPVASVPKGRSKSSVKPLPKDGRYVVKAGDSLWKIAERYGLKVSDLRSWNSLKTDMLQIDQVLLLKGTSTGASPAAVSSPSGKAVKKSVKGTKGAGTSGSAQKAAASSGVTGLSGDKHIVKSGESLWKIARRYKVSQDDLMKWNGLKTNKLQINQVLVIKPGKSSTAPAASPAPVKAASEPAVMGGNVSGGNTTAEVVDLNSIQAATPENNTQPVSAFPTGTATGGQRIGEYIVADGDTLEIILQEKGVRLEDFRKLNPTIDMSKPLTPGTILKLPL